MDNSESLKIIGIHNEHPSVLFIQFSMGERYFMYELNRIQKSEHIHEQVYTPLYREAALDPKDEEFLIGKLAFFPKTKRIINEYRYDEIPGIIRGVALLI